MSWATTHVLKVSQGSDNAKTRQRHLAAGVLHMSLSWRKARRHDGLCQNGCYSSATPIPVLVGLVQIHKDRAGKREELACTLQAIAHQY